MRLAFERTVRLALPMLIGIGVVPIAGAQDDHDHGEGGHVGPRIVEQHRWSTPEGRLMAYYSAALAFSPVGAPRVDAPWGGSFGLELSYVPELSEAQRSAGFSKTESTNLAPIVPRPRFALSLPGGFGIEASWVPPVEAFGVKANLFSAAVTRSFPVGNGVLLTPRIAGTTGSVKGPITCNQELEERGGGDGIFYAHVCHSIESEDRFEPMSVSGELVASRALRAGSLTPYAGLGLRHERTTFDVGVRYSDGSIDANHPILKLDLTRGYGFLGATWAGPRRTALSGEMFYAPGSLLTGRIQASIRLFGS